MKSAIGFRFTSRNRKKWLRAALFLLPSLTGVALFVLLPFWDVVRRSFQTTLTGEAVGMRNYQAVLSNQAFLLAAKNTLRFLLICLPLLIVLSLLLAWRISFSRYQRFFKSAYLLPMAIPTATVAFLWKLLFHGQGLMNALLSRFGCIRLDFLGSDLSFWVLILSYLWKNLGYTLVLWLCGIQSIPNGILEAARIDGAGETALFVRIVLPNLRPTLYTITVLSFLNSFKVFREAYLVCGSYPQERMYLLQHLFNNWFLSLDMDKLSAAAVLLALALTGVILIFKLLWDRKEEWV